MAGAATSFPHPPNPPKAFFSHDEYIDFFDDTESTLEGAKRHFAHLLQPPSAYSPDSGRQRITQDGTPLTPELLHPDRKL